MGRSQAGHWSSTFPGPWIGLLGHGGIPGTGSAVRQRLARKPRGTGWQRVGDKASVATRGEGRGKRRLTWDPGSTETTLEWVKSVGGGLPP